MINTSLMLRSFHISTVIFAVTVLFFDRTLAQFEQPGGSKSLFSGASGMSFGGTQQQWTLKDSGTVSQQSAPISISIPLGNRMLFSVTNSGAITKFDTAKISSIVDTRLSLSYVFPGEKFWLTGGISMPTGKTKLNTSQLQLAALISQTAFAYRVPTFGQGLSGNIALVYAGTITRRMVVGLGASYYYKGMYEPVEAASKFEYDAGDEFSLNLGYDFITYSKIARISFDITATYFFEDKLNGTTVFHSGPRMIGLAAYTLKTGSMNHLLQVRVRYRLPNTFYNGSITTKYDATTQMEGLYSLSYPLNEWLLGTAVGELKMFTADQIPVAGVPIETGKAEIGSAGFDLTFLFSDFFYPTLNVRYALGNIMLEGVTRDVQGVEAGLGIRIVF